MTKIIIIGAGAMGSAFTIPCVENGNDVTLIGTHLENDLIDKISKSVHPTLKVALPKKLKIEKFDKIEDYSDADLIVCAVSSLGVDWFIDQISKIKKKELNIILLTKGLAIQEGKLITISDKIKSELKKKRFNDIVVSAIKGPCLAAGLANKMRTGTVIANENKEIAKLIQKVITTEYYSTETLEDVKGVEFCGAIKNIYSMLIGASEGLSNPSAPESIRSKFFLNTSASLIHRSISEMVKFVKYFGGKEATVYGLAGLGDLYVSAIGGRNSQMGKHLGEGTLYKDAKEKFMKEITVEGAQLALEIGPILLKELNKDQFPLMFNILETICNNKKLSINW
jgi:glycerol-3-phosphate dehydrogenase (NAD(P)+)